MIGKKRKSTGSGFKSEIKKLAKQDPDFYEYLKTDEADIFEFSDDDEGTNLDEEVEEDDYGGSVEDDSDADLKSDLDEENVIVEDESEEKINLDEEVEFEGSAEDIADEEMNDVNEDSSDEEIEDEKNYVLVNLTNNNSHSIKVRCDPATQKKLVDLNLINYLTQVLSQPLEHRASLAQAVKVSVDCFNACIAKVGGGRVVDDQKKEKRKKKKKLKKKSNMLKSDFVVISDEVFGEAVRMCFNYLGRCFMILMNPTDRKKNVVKLKKKKLKARPKRASSTTFKNWHKYGVLTRRYLFAVYTFLNELQHNEDILENGLKGVADLVDIYLHFPKLCKHLIKIIVKFWSRKNEAVQSATFIVLCKMVRLDCEIFSLVYKSCYVSYIANCKQVNSDTLPLIKFMQKSIAELTFLVPKKAYDFAFVYIRQFTIHLRNAVAAKKKDLIPSIYNWQFLNGLALWTIVVSQSTKTPQLFVWFKDLRHPLVEIIIIFMKIFMSGKFLPLAIFCARLLLQIQVMCKIFIPTLAMSIDLLEYLQEINKKKPTTGKEAEKVIVISEIFRLSKSQVADSGIRLCLAEELFKLCLECAYALKCHPTFPQIVVPLEIRVKNFVKKNKNREHSELFKLFNQKLKEHAAEISKVISSVRFDLNEYDSEFDQTFAELDKKSTLVLFYNSYMKSWKVKLETKKAVAEKEAKKVVEVKAAKKRLDKKKRPMKFV